jgi:hypothetical protein
MSNWITTANAKIYLWITDSSQDAKINLLIPAIQENLIKIIWDIQSSDKTDRISFCDVDSEWGFIVNYWPVTAVKKINWTTYTWTIDEDYQITNWRKLIISDWRNYLDTSYFNTFDITYTSWYSTIPTDIQLLMYIMLSAELNRDWGKQVDSYKVWDVSVSYVNSEATPLIIQSIISKYKLINI